MASLHANYSMRFPFCGCWFYVEGRKWYLPLVQTKTHATILSTASHTVLEQTFTNASTTDAIPKCTYEFPLYDGVSVTGFTCSIGEKKLFGVVNESATATRKFEEAVARGESAGLLEQDVQASDVFRTVLGNIPPGETIRVRIEHVGELKQDAEIGGLRLTIPSIIAPRYGSDILQPFQNPTGIRAEARGMNVIVDVNLADGSPVQAIESPSHPIGVSIGTLSTDQNADPALTKGSASLSLQETALDKDFVLLVKAKDVDVPQAILEQHPTVDRHRAIMTTLVPRFELPLIQPEVVFIADRSGSMGPNIDMLKQAMAVFLKSIPPGTKFNICSFGNRCDFLWQRSQLYTKESLETASKHVESFRSNYGGTETLRALQATVAQRYQDLPLDIVLLTDGDIWDQETAFKWLGSEVKKSDGQIRIFPLGIGNGVSHALIEGLARAGNGFAQTVQVGERMDKKVVRMLKGALSPHISDYSLEVVFSSEDDFEMVERVSENLTIRSKNASGKESSTDAQQASTPQKSTISLFDTSANPFTAPKESPSSGPDLPDIPTPNLLQAPTIIPALYPFVRTTVYLLLAPSTYERNPEAVVLRASSQHGPLELLIPIKRLEQPGRTIHCLAARKAAQDLEEGRGWLHEAKDETGEVLSKTLPSKFQDVVRREAVRLGETFQVVNRWCSFVAVEADSEQGAQEKNDDVRNDAFKVRPSAQSSWLDQYQVNNLNSVRYRRASRGFGGPPPPAPAPWVSDMAMPTAAATSFAPPLRAEAPAPGRRSTDRNAVAPSDGLSSCLFGSFTAATGGLFGSPAMEVSAPAGRSGSFGGHGGGRGGTWGGSRGGLSARDTSFESAASYGARSPPSSGRERTFGAPPPPACDGMQGSSGCTTVQHSHMMQPPAVAPHKKKLASSEPSTMPVLPKDAADRVLRMISLQEFDGHWTVSSELAALLEIDHAAMTGQSDIQVTAMVLCFLEQRMSGERDVWEMVAEKAQGWLQANGADVAQVKQSAWAVMDSKA